MKKALVLASAAALFSMPASAANFSFTGTFTRDDNVQLFNFTVGATSTVTLRTWSYAGGTNAAGQSIARGGFDPILALFDSSGARINQNDDGGGNVPGDSLTGAHFDTFLQSTLGPGTYTVSVMQYDNFSLGNLAAGFARQGQGNFTPLISPNCVDGGTQFRDVTSVHGCLRDGHWAFDVLNVASATTGVPEPAAWAMMLAGFGLLGGALRRGRAQPALSYS